MLIDCCCCAYLLSYHRQSITSAVVHSAVRHMVPHPQYIHYTYNCQTSAYLSRTLANVSLTDFDLGYTIGSYGCVDHGNVCSEVRNRDFASATTPLLLFSLHMKSNAGCLLSIFSVVEPISLNNGELTQN